MAEEVSHRNRDCVKCGVSWWTASINNDFICIICYEQEDDTTHGW